MIANLVQCPIKVTASFLVHGNPVRPGLDEDRDELVGILDHQVTVKRQLSGLAQGLHDGRPDGQVGNEVAVHDVDMDYGPAAFGGTTNLVRQMGEIRRQYRRCEFDQTWVPQGNPCGNTNMRHEGKGLETVGSQEP